MSTGKTNLTSTQFSAKKLLGKAHTSNIFSDVNEAIPSNVSMPSDGVFAEAIPNSPGDTFYTLMSASDGGPTTVERVYFDVVALTNTIYDADDDTGGGGDEASVSGSHGFYLKLPAAYQTTSSNPQRGTGSFVNGQRIYDTRGALQLVPPLISNASPNKYFLKLYKGDPSNGANEITSGDAIDWQVDYYSGVIFVQDYNASTIPVTASAYLYTGKYLNEKLTDISSESGANITVKDEGVDKTTNATSFNFVGAAVTATNSGTDVTVTLSSAVVSRTPVTSTITSSVNDQILGVSASAALDIRLPAATGFTGGSKLIIKDEAGNASNFNITIKTTGGDKIDGATSIILNSDHAAVNLYTNGSDKFFIY